MVIFSGRTYPEVIRQRNETNTIKNRFIATVKFNTAFDPPQISIPLAWYNIFPPTLAFTRTFSLFVCYNDITMEEMMDQVPDEILAEEEKQPETKSKLWWIILIAVVLIGLIVTGIVFLTKAGAEATSQVRDIFIIFLVLESFVIGVVLVILVVQITTLVNLVQNEIKPILKSTTDTINTLKGTTQFLSQNLVDPVIKVNSYTAGIRRLLDLINIFKK